MRTRRVCQHGRPDLKDPPLRCAAKLSLSRTSMRLSRFFIMRPIFAAVIAVIITLVGTIAYWSLPVSQYPEIVPPTVTISINTSEPVSSSASASTMPRVVSTFAPRARIPLMC